MANPQSDPTGERAEILRILAEQRSTLLITVRGISDADAGRHTTVSALTLGGIIHHLTRCEASWLQIMTEPVATIPPGMIDEAQYRMPEDRTLAELLEAYAAVARATEDAVAALPDLDQQIRLPEFPWAPGATMRWSARHILLHLIRETAQHCGHADIIREALDGANTTRQMGEDLARQSG